MSDFSSLIASPTLSTLNVRMNHTEHLEEMKELREAAKEKKAFQEFEQMFAHLLLKEMRKTVNDSSFTEKSHATKMYEQMMDESLAEQMAKSGQLGIGKQLMESQRAENLRQEIQATEKNLVRGAFEPLKANSIKE